MASTSAPPPGAPSPAPTRSLSFLHQPGAVWATAFAATVGFTSIGLVDPILTSIAAGLAASPSQVSLLFTSYFAVTALMMLVTGFVSSRIGGRNAMLVGAALIVVFAALSGTSNSIAELVTFRAGWALGNSLFVATALAVIVGAASGGIGAAILLYEAALGVGLSVGPLIGAALGDLSWRYPFYGTAALMLIGLLAIALVLPRQKPPARKIGLTEPLKALRHPGLAVTAVSALFYNYAFFTVLAFTPFALQMSAHATGLVFFGWGMLVALFSVVVAPRLQNRFREVTILAGSLLAFALTLAAMAFGSPAVIAAAVVASGAMSGLNNTVYTAMALEVSGAPRPVASSGYNFIRWIAGVVAPYAAPEIAETFGMTATFLIASAAAVIAIAVLVTMRTQLGRFGAAAEPVAGPAVSAAAARPILVAVDGTASDRHVLGNAADLARMTAVPIRVVHVSPVEVFDEYAAETESPAGASLVVQNALETLRAAGLAAQGELAEDVSGHVSQVILRRAAELDVLFIVLGARHRHDPSDAVHGSVADQILKRSRRPVMVVPELAA